MYLLDNLIYEMITNFLIVILCRFRSFRQLSVRQRLESIRQRILPFELYSLDRQLVKATAKSRLRTTCLDKR